MPTRLCERDGSEVDEASDVVLQVWIASFGCIRTLIPCVDLCDSRRTRMVLGPLCQGGMEEYAIAYMYTAYRVQSLQEDKKSLPMQCVTGLAGMPRYSLSIGIVLS